MKNDVSLAKVLFLEDYRHELMQWLGDVLDAELGRRLNFTIGNGIVDFVLLRVQRWVWLGWLLLILGL